MSETKNNPLVSIILPCYNMEKYLERSVQSILKDSYRPLEIILVNDGSADSTGEMIDRFATEHREIVAIHKENGGVASARNAGIDRATGKYLMFVDPDDYVLPGFVTDAVNRMEQTRADMVYFGMRTPWFNPPEKAIDYLPLQDYYLTSNEEIIKSFLWISAGASIDKYHRWLAGDKDWNNGTNEVVMFYRFIYSRDFIERNHIRCRNLKLGEDQIWILDCLSRANTLATVMTAPYVYLPLREGALSSNLKADRIFETKIKILIEKNRLRKEILDSSSIDIANCFEGSLIFSTFQLGYAMAISGNFRNWKTYVDSPLVQKAIDSLKPGWPTSHLTMGGGKTLVTNHIA